MKVYVLEKCYDYEGCDAIGVASHLEVAKEMAMSDFSHGGYDEPLGDFTEASNGCFVIYGSMSYNITEMEVQE